MRVVPLALLQDEHPYDAEKKGKKNKEKWIEKEKRLLTQLNTESDQIRWTQKN